MGSTPDIQSELIGSMSILELFFKKCHYLINKYRKNIDFLIQIYYNPQQV